MGARAKATSQPNTGIMSLRDGQVRILARSSTRFIFAPSPAGITVHLRWLGASDLMLCLLSSWLMVCALSSPEPPRRDPLWSLLFTFLQRRATGEQGRRQVAAHIGVTQLTAWIGLVLRGQVLGIGQQLI